MATSGFTNFIDCAALKIYALPEAEISVTNGMVSKTLDIDDAYEVNADDIIYIIYIQSEDFGNWFVSNTINNNTSTKAINITNFKLYTIDFIVPITYQRLEYLESNATPYIQTNIPTSSVNGYDFKFQPMVAYTGQTLRSFFGTRGTSNQWMFNVCTWDGYLYAETYPPGENKLAQTDTKIHRIQAGAKYEWNCYYDNKFFKTNSPMTSSSNTVIYLFTEHNGANATAARASVRIFYLKLYSDLVLTHNIVAVKRISDSVLGMYDVITDTFYTNAGSGSFTAGSSVDIKNPPLYLYNYGNENIVITGGFETKNSDSRYQTSGATVTKNRTDILLKNVSNASIAVTTKNKIDVSNYNTLEFVAYRASSAGDSAYYGLSSTGLPDANGAHSLAGNLAAASWSTDSFNPTIRTLDISSFAGEYYVWFGGLTSNGIYLQQIRLY